VQSTKVYAIHSLFCRNPQATKSGPKRRRLHPEQGSRAILAIHLAVHERADRDAALQLPRPVLVLWGEEGVVHRCFRPLDEWRRLAPDVRGRPLPSGHYTAEEAPDQRRRKPGR
jgi:pimeloyl-ACP methyl ester carboxylesterase